MYVVSTVLFRRTRWRKQLFFPVRGRFFYDSVGRLARQPLDGLVVDVPALLRGRRQPEDGAARVRQVLDAPARRALCREGAGNVIGFHPEGTRNKGADPYSYLRPQPGVGKLIKDARPQVVPVFIAGLGNDLPKQVLGNWRGGEPVRVHFGPALDFSEFYERRDSVRTYKEIADFVMSKIAELGEQDRAALRPRSQARRA